MEKWSFIGLLFLSISVCQSQNGFEGLFLQLLRAVLSDGSTSNVDYIINGVRILRPSELEPIQSDTFTLTWHHASNSDIQANIYVLTSNEEAVVGSPQRGEFQRVPESPTELVINFECNPQVNEVDVAIDFTFHSLTSGSINYTINFQKVCSGQTTDTASSSDQNVRNILFVVTGLVAGVVVIIIVIVVLYHWRVLRDVLRGRRTDSEDFDDMSRDALEAEVFGGLQHYQSEPVSMYPMYQAGVSIQIGATTHVESENVLFPTHSGMGRVPQMTSPVRRTWTFQSLKERAVDERRLSMGDLLRQGQFALIYEGYLTNAEDDVEGGTAVLVKTIKDDSPESILNQFMESVMLLRHTNHRHCFSLLGVLHKEAGAPMFLFPKTLYGSLKHLLNDVRDGAGNSVLKQGLSTQHLVYMSMQIARGMYHITKKLNLVHKDLAARSIYVHEGLRIKIGDSALGWDLFPDDYQMLATGEMIAVRWQAIEVLQEGLYTLYSDVWSFGVVLWEILSLGAVPYDDLPVEHMVAYLSAGRRLLQPKHCPDELFSVMGQCWALTAGDRPRFSYLTIALEEFHSKLNSFI